jgi:hypothetical protein
MGVAAQAFTGVRLVDWRSSGLLGQLAGCASGHCCPPTGGPVFSYRQAREQLIALIPSTGEQVLIAGLAHFLQEERGPPFGLLVAASVLPTPRGRGRIRRRTRVAPNATPGPQDT